MTQVSRLQPLQRVWVKAVGGDDTPLPEPQLGTVVRLRRGDNGAWVCLDVRQEQLDIHPFPVGDSRANYVLAYPNNCEEE